MDDQPKGSRGCHERFVGTCRFLHEVNPARRSQLAAAVSHNQQAAADDDDCQKITRLKLQRPLLLLLLRRERPHHKRTSVEWQKGQAETAIMGSKGNKNTCCLSLQLDIKDTAGPIYHYSFYITYVYIVLPAAT